MVDAADSKSALGNKVLVRVRSSVMFNKYFSKKKLVCFDFDGLLVNTEPLHFKAYDELFKQINYPLNLHFERYCNLAHDPDRDLFEKTVKKAYPDFPYSWKDIRQKKTQIYQKLLKEQPIYPMVGAKELIEKLHFSGIDYCIVTNSCRDDVETIARKIPFLQKMTLIAREDYNKPKPSADPYEFALKKYSIDPTDAIGLEDTKKGISALKEASMDFLLINTKFNDHEHLFPTLAHFV